MYLPGRAKFDTRPPHTPRKAPPPPPKYSACLQRQALGAQRQALGARPRQVRCERLQLHKTGCVYVLPVLLYVERARARAP